MTEERPGMSGGPLDISSGHGNGDFAAALGRYSWSVADALDAMKADRVIQRIREHDHTVWKPDPHEIINRLGWIEAPSNMRSVLTDIDAFVNSLMEQGFTRALLLGMGGSSLAPEVFRKAFGVQPGRLDLAVLDSTHPDAVSACSRLCEPEKTVYIVSTKSGGTVETDSFMKYFYRQAKNAMGPGEAGRRFIAITDPGSPLEDRAGELGFHRVFLNDPNIGGRYSALSFFGLVPAAMVGVDTTLLLDRAMDMVSRCLKEEQNPGVLLGAVMGVLAKEGRDKMTLVMSPALSGFGSWIEQLIAESTGKDGKGILPVNEETLMPPGHYSKDRFFIHLRIHGDESHDRRLHELVRGGHPVVRIGMRDIYDIGMEFYRWEMAVAVAGRVLGINPFDQPNVESAKAVARSMLEVFKREGHLPEQRPAIEKDGIKVYGDIDAGEDPVQALEGFLSEAWQGDESGSGRSYIALHAYLAPDEELDADLETLRKTINSSTGMAVTVGYGPRFLHSTGQLHKGDAGRGLFVVFTDHAKTAPAIPDNAWKAESSINFGILKSAQALGDRQALIDGGRKVISFDLGRDVKAGLEYLAKGLGKASRER